MIRFEQVTFTYPGAEGPAIKAVNLHIPVGELALVIGPSGSGKSTLLRCTNGLVPHFSGGSLQGTIRVDGLDPVEVTPRVMSRHVGFVFQDPESQFVVDRVEDEIAFSLENAAVPPNEMAARVEEVMGVLELTPLRDRRLETLSGGERQRVAIAAALTLRPSLLVLDEPTSQLDPGSAEEVLRALVRLNHELGLTILMAEHRLERVLPFAHLLIHLDGESQAIISGPPRKVLENIDLNPPLVSVAKTLGWQPLPLTIEEGRLFADSYLGGNTANMDTQGKSVGTPQRTPTPQPADTRPYIRATGVEVSYGSQPALCGVDLNLWPGEILVLMGANGAGKTTLLRCLVGLVRPSKGRITVAGEDIAGRGVADVCQEVAYLPQDPNALLFSDTVRDELLLTLYNRGEGDRRDATAYEAQITTLLDYLGLGGKAEAYPRDLSAGERQRVALGAVTITRPGALLLDEPTRGLDYAAKRALIELLGGWRDEGMAVLLVTHDVELAAAAAERVVLLDDGTVTASGTPSEVLGGSPLFAPQIAQLFPDTGWLTAEDIPLPDNYRT
jgi:energy-coupling factor transport system ATP-binding protein